MIQCGGLQHRCRRCPSVGRPGGGATVAQAPEGDASRVGGSGALNSAEPPVRMRFRGSPMRRAPYPAPTGLGSARAGRMKGGAAVACSCV